MPTDSQIGELLSRWLALRAQGQPVSAEELCRGCPEMLDELRARIERTVVDGGRPPRIDQPLPLGDQSPTEPLDDSRRNDTEDLLAFLSPPQGPEEIGRLGPYRVVKLLGAGGMGAVFQAVDTQLGRSVALKTLRPILAGHAVARKRFLREARAAAALEHDNVVALHHVGEDHEVPFLVMPFLHGESLHDHLEGGAMLPTADILRIGREIADGLASAAHEHGLIHRDIKPGNIWLEAPRRRVKILDFGLAHIAEDSDAHLTQTGAVMGTPAFMSPEQATGEHVDHRSDLFSLGSVLYRMATGRVPFQGKSTALVLATLVRDDPPPPRSLNPDLPAPLAALIGRLLAKDPDHRPPTARAVVDAIEKIECERPAVILPGLVIEPPRTLIDEATHPLSKPSAGRRRVPIAAIIPIGLLGAALAAFVVYMTTDRGELVIETKVPDVSVVVKVGKGVRSRC